MAAAGGDLTQVRSGLDGALRASVAFDFASISTVDPATMLWTSCFTSGLPPGGEAERERVIFELQFEGEDINGYTELANTGQLVGRLHEATGGVLPRAKRWEPLLSSFDVVHEMRVILMSREMVWGTLTLYRAAPRQPFSDRDEAVIRSALGDMADLFRLAMLRAAISAPTGLDRPPGMLLVSSSGEVTALSDAARRWLDTLDNRGRIPSVVRSVASAAAAGNGLAYAAVPTAAGRWVVLHASPLEGHAAAMGIIIEEARPVTISEVIAGAHGLTTRERAVTRLASQGRSTRQIGMALGISPFTVQDHLKAVFAKVGVQSRGEPVAALYIQHCVPRREAGATPSPYGWYLDDTAVAG